MNNELIARASVISRLDAAFYDLTAIRNKLDELPEGCETLDRGMANLDMAIIEIRNAMIQTHEGNGWGGVVSNQYWMNL